MSPEALQDVPTGEPHKPLSDRERQLIEFASNGFTDTAIANRLGISEATVATYWGRIRSKYGPLPRPELIAILVREKYEEEIDSLKSENNKLLRDLRQTDGSRNGAPDDFFRDVLESVMDAVLVVDSQGTIDWINSAAVSLFGYDRASVTGKHISALVPERYRKIHSQHVANYFSAPSKCNMAEHSTTFALSKDGEEIAIAATLAPVETDGQTLVVCAVRPLSSISAGVLRARAKAR
jgi:PAS domain S-box-containing protein